MKLVNLIPLKEIDFKNQNQFDAYIKQHELRPATKVTIAGKTTTAGQAAKNSEPAKGSSVFGKDSGGSVFGKSGGASADNSNWMDDLDSIDVSDIKGKANPNADSWKHDDVFGATFKDPKTGKTTTVGDAYDREDDSPAYQKAFAYVSKFDPDGEAVMGTQAYSDLQKNAAPKADVKSIVKGLLKTADKEFGGAYKLKDVVNDFKDSVDDSDADGKELKARLDKGENGIYVQTNETEGTVVFKDGSQYKFSHVEDGPIPVTKVGNEEPKTSDKLSSMIPKSASKDSAQLPNKASKLNYKHAESLEKAVNAGTGLKGYVDTDDNTDAIMYNASKGNQPTYTLYFGGNDDYGKPDEFRVSLLPTYGNDPANVGDKVDKTFQSGDEAMKFMVVVAKKYKKELEMDDSND
jgi:hypothetical protein